MAVALGVATVLASLAALALDKSLPYRIGYIDYHRYTWVGRLIGVSVGLALLSFVCTTSARKGSWFPFGLALLGVTPLLFIGGVHSGPNPEAWCFNNLRRIDGGKEQLAGERGLTNGSSVPMTDIDRFMPAGELRCAEGGRYIINPIGSDARCTFHGTITEMEANWQKRMRAQ